MFYTIPDCKVHGANMGPTWVLSAPDGPHFINKLLTWFLMDCLASCVFFKVVFLTKLTTPAWLSSIANHHDRWPWTNEWHCCHCITTCHWLDHAPTFYRVLWLVSESYCTPELWHHDLDVGNQNMMMLLIFQVQLAMCTEENSTWWKVCQC